MKVVDAVVKSEQVELTEQSEAKAVLLGMIAENKPFVFITVEMATDEEGEHLLLDTLTDVPTEIREAVLRVALEEFE